MKLILLSSWKDNVPFIGIAVGLFGITVLSLASFFSIDEFQKHSEHAEHTHRVLFELEKTMFTVRDAQAATRGFSITGKQEFLIPYEDAQQQLPEKISALRTLIADNPTQVRNIDLLKAETDRVMSTLTRTVSLRRHSATADPAMANIASGNGEAALWRVKTLVAKMQSLEDELLIQRERKVILSGKQTKWLIVYGTLAAYLVFGATFWKLNDEVDQRQRADKALLEANNELLQHAEQLESANKELESFSYSISHDLRIPLRAISGYAGMLAEDYEGKLDSEGRRLLNVIRENSKRMGALIDDLLAFSRLGRQILSSANLDMLPLVEKVVTEMQQRDYPKAIVVVDTLPPAWGDRALLQQVWINLISNALKYSAKTAAPEIHISATSGEHEIIYAVRDNGVGFDMQYYNKLFGVFQRLHNADEFPGTGVGLAIVQRIVLRHGGRVWAESTLNQGAVFFFALPHREPI